MSELFVDKISSQGGTSALDIRSNGIVENKAFCGFSVGFANNTDQTGIANQTYTKATFIKTNVDHAFDTHSGWSDTDHAYTVPTNCGGYWLLSSWAEFNVTTTSTIVTITKGITVTGDNSQHYVRSALGDNTNSSPNTQPLNSFMVFLNAGESVHTQVYHQYGSDAQILAPDPTHTYVRSGMQGWRIG